MKGKFLDMQLASLLEVMIKVQATQNKTEKN
jgi:hypothetical protein